MAADPHLKTAVVLAAGVGSRLMPLTADLPKVLVPVAGRPLLGRLLDACAAAGLGRALVVTGYRHDAIERWLRDDPPALPTTTTHNEAYAERGNAWSLRLALDELGEEAIIKLDGDLLLDPSIISDLLRCPWSAAIAIDDTARLDEEAMKASCDEQGRVVALGKWLRPAESKGESIGAEKLAAEDAQPLRDAIDALVIHGGNPDAYYEDCYHALLERGWQLGSISVGTRRWTEVDDHDDLRRACELVGEAEP